MCSVVLDAAHVFMRCPILDAVVDAIMGVFVGDILPKITVSLLVYLLVVSVSLLVVTASVPTTAIASSRLSAVMHAR